MHVNADDLEACIAAVRLGVAYRTKFKKDFLIDLVGYRRHGHNEGDEPTFTQPTLVRGDQGAPDAASGVGRAARARRRRDAEDVQAAERDSRAAAREDVRRSEEGARRTITTRATGSRRRRRSWRRPCAPSSSSHSTSSCWRGRRGSTRIRDWPSSSSAGARRWARPAASTGVTPSRSRSRRCSREGTSVRLTGQDAERGTFSHRHAVLHDPDTGQTFTPLQHLPNARGTFEIYNSPLSETGVLGFEYGYSTAADDALVLWEAQFGDFVNVAQPIIDQFIAADRAKWAQDSGVVMLLPHGYEGQGPEHSSARLERFLQLCADGNMTVAYPSTPAQYFHILRRQAKSESRRPLVLMQPKSLLRLAAGGVAARGPRRTGASCRVIDDQTVGDRRDDVQRVVFCTGKLYYDLDRRRSGRRTSRSRGSRSSIRGRPSRSRAIVDLYPNVAEVVWAQEEPKNMGAWSYVAPRLRACTGNAMLIRYIGRPERASPAEGYVDVASGGAGAHRRRCARGASEAEGGGAVVRRAHREHRQWRLR